RDPAAGREPPRLGAEPARLHLRSIGFGAGRSVIEHHERKRPLARRPDDARDQRGAALGRDGRLLLDEVPLVAGRLPGLTGDRTTPGDDFAGLASMSSAFPEGDLLGVLRARGLADALLSRPAGGEEGTLVVKLDDDLTRRRLAIGLGVV